ncbi:hypothetical protein ERIC2_10p00060 (plasmid) [Paenibacillus larvae subsp. larvae DSM 25430]|uniref:Uncharacterized protein n=1 Tax=Paenibacillus larvae subsp. larvae DSM 25430 TaxID=697284 RepID=V9WDL1_9BACL|nr:hypothetical protein ERIC2_10p00060 [Paenibacillus larvae subsp. larvae DSM 25430]
MLVINQTLENVINQYSLLGLPFLVIVIASLLARWNRFLW